MHVHVPNAVMAFARILLCTAAGTSSCLHLSDNGAGGGALVSPGRRQDADGLVVAGETVDARLDQNQAELGVLVLPVALEVLADSNGLGTVSSGYNKFCRRRGARGTRAPTFLINM